MFVYGRHVPKLWSLYGHGGIGISVSVVRVSVQENMVWEAAERKWVFKIAECLCGAAKETAHV